MTAGAWARSFGYDILVNLLANIGAVAVAYPAGVAVGLFPREPIALAGSLAIIVVGVASVAVLAGRLAPEPYARLASAIGLALLPAGVLIVLAVSTSTGGVLPASLELVPLVAIVVLSATMLSVGKQSTRRKAAGLRGPVRRPLRVLRPGAPNTTRTRPLAPRLRVEGAGAIPPVAGRRGLTRGPRLRRGLVGEQRRRPRARERPRDSL